MPEHMIVRFLKKECATRDLILILTSLGIVRHRSRPFKTSPRELWVSDHEIKVFATRWVKNHNDE